MKPGYSLKNGVIISVALLLLGLFPAFAAGAAYKLVFTSQPVGSSIGASLGNVVVQIADNSGANVSQSGTVITVSLNKSGGFSGVTSVATDASGKATFTSLKVNLPGTNYTLVATGKRLQNANSRAFDVAKGSATVTLTSSTNNLIYGQGIIFTAAVKAVAPATNALTGTITFLDGGVILGSATINGNGTAAFSTNKIPAATTMHTITAAYSGDGNYSGVTSSNLPQTVSKRALTVTGISADDKIYDGTTNAILNFTNAQLATVLAGDAVTLNTTGASGAFANRNAGNGKTVTVSGLAITGTSAGNYSLIQPTTTANITPAFLTVSAGNLLRAYATTNPPLVAIYSNFVPGESTNNSDLTGSPVLATTAKTNSAVGSYAITITKGTLVSSNYSLIFSNGTLTVTKADTTALLTTTVNPALTNQNVTFTANVTPVVATVMPPNGNVQFKCNGTNIPGGMVSITGGQASLTKLAGSLGQGNCIITAEFFDPSGNFSASTNVLSENIVTATVPPPPCKMSITPALAGGKVTANLVGTAGATYIIQASADFVHWTPISTNVADVNGLVSLVDSNSVVYPARFYRAYSP